MAKNWWFKFEWHDWLTDDDLLLCSFEAQGFWLRCLCLMYKSGKYELTGTVDDLRRLLGCLPEEVTRNANELKRTGAADVRFGNGEVSIKSRRLEREAKSKENNRLYVAKHRAKDECKTDVRQQSKSKSKSKTQLLSLDNNCVETHNDASAWDYPVRDLVEAFPDVVLTPAAAGFIEAEVLLGDETAWANTLKIYKQNYDPMLNRYLPEKTGNLLGVFRSEKAKLEKAKNGTSKQSGKSNIRVLEESADYFDAKYGPAS